MSNCCYCQQLLVMSHLSFCRTKLHKVVCGILDPTSPGGAPKCQVWLFATCADDTSSHCAYVLKHASTEPRYSHDAGTCVLMML